MTLLATADGARVLFEDKGSTFQALTVQADNGIDVAADLTTKAGDILLNGDADDTVDTEDGITLTGSRTIDASQQLVMQSTSGGIVRNSAVALRAGAGVHLLQDLSSTASMQQLSIHADTDGDGGTLTIPPGVSVDSLNSMVYITAADVDMEGGELTAGNAAITVHGSITSQNIGLGVSAQTLHLTGSEIAQITAGSGLTIGGDATGNLYVDGLTSEDTSTVDTIVLMATRASHTVIFHNTGTTFNKGINIQAANGIVLSQNVTILDTPSEFYTGTGGTLTVAASASLESRNQALTLDVDDIDLKTDSAISTGSATLQLGTVSSIGIGLGDTSDMGVSVSGDELQKLYADGLRIGTATSTDVKVDGVTSAHSSSVVNIITLAAVSDGSQVLFEGSPSTFNHLVVEAQNGVSFDTVLTVSAVQPNGGSLLVNGDYDSSADGDSDNKITVSNGQSVAAQTLLTLACETGSILLDGAVTLQAGSGLILHDDATHSAAATVVVVDADFDSHGDGTFTISASSAVGSTGDVLVTAWDVDLDGEINMGNSGKTLAVHGSKSSQTLGLGQTAKDMYLDGTEVGKITSVGTVSFGYGAGTGSVLVDGLTDGNTENIALFKVGAPTANTFVEMKNNPSIFHALEVEADAGILVEVDVTTTTGDLVLDGDMEDNADANTLEFSDGITVTAAETLTLHASSLGEFCCCFLALLLMHFACRHLPGRRSHPQCVSCAYRGQPCQQHAVGRLEASGDHSQCAERRWALGRQRQGRFQQRQ